MLDWVLAGRRLPLDQPRWTLGGEGACSPKTRHCSGQSIGRSMSLLIPNPRGNRPSVAIDSKMQHTLFVRRKMVDSQSPEARVVLQRPIARAKSGDAHSLD